jgi:gamma-aminobutyric acid type B receptor
MQLLCVGSILESSSIFTLSFDEGAGWSDKQLDVACMLTPWFFFIGQTMMFSALFTKLWRVDRVLQFRRTAVSVKNVIGPLVALLVITMSILIAWTIIDPWTWERELIKKIPAETYGQCTSDHTWAFFGPLMSILIFAELLTMFFAWKTADVPEDFRDSGAVMYACFAQIQAWAIGVPMLAVLGYSSANASYFGKVILIWIFAVSGVAVVVGPKIVKAIKVRRNPELGNKKGRVRVTGVYQKNGNSQATAESQSVKISALSETSGPHHPS